MGALRGASHTPGDGSGTAGGPAQADAASAPPGGAHAGKAGEARPPGGAGGARDIIVRHLGELPYRSVLAAMQAFTRARGPGTPDELWLVEHPPVFTLGLNGAREHLLAPGDIEVVRTDRGGQVTYHGPGQLVLYALLELRRFRLGPRSLVSWLEEGVIATLAHWHIDGRARRDAPGVYIGERKIASVGLRIRRGCSYHGLALNVSLDPAPFARINPCGYAGMEVTRVCDEGGPSRPEALAGRLVETLIGQLERTAGVPLRPLAGAGALPQVPDRDEPASTPADAGAQRPTDPPLREEAPA